MKAWSNLATVVYKRTYSRAISPGVIESWPQTVDRVIRGNVSGHDVSIEEANQLEYMMLKRKAGPAGRGLWFSGTEGQKTLGGAALNNCWFLSGDDWQNFVIAQDLLMLGGGVGMSVEHRFVSKLPRVKKDVNIVHRGTNDADLIV